MQGARTRVVGGPAAWKLGQRELTADRTTAILHGDASTAYLCAVQLAHHTAHLLRQRLHLRLQPLYLCLLTLHSISELQAEGSRSRRRQCSRQGRAKEGR